MEETRKREDDHGEDAAAKNVRTAAEADGGEDDVMTWLIAGESEEFTAEELMKLLEDDGGGGGGEPSAPAPAWRGSFRVRFIEDPYATPVVFQSASSPGYITINGNEESCGSSFSDSDASVMASVDARGLIGIAGYLGGDGGGAWGTSEGEARGGVVGSSSGTEAFDDDDELLARFLGEEDDCV